MPPRKKIPPDNHIIRYVSWTRLRKDENDKVIGILNEAFKRKENEKGLSTTWLEYFPGDRENQKIAAVQAMRASKLVVTSKSGFAFGKVGDIQSACINRGTNKVRIIHTPSKDNEAHVDVLALPREDSDLLELLATEVWNDYILNSDIPD
jgi:hypothetical protein